MEIPDAQRLLASERDGRRAGTGLTTADVIGSWRLERIWSKGSAEPSGVAAAVLRGLSARLEVTPAPPLGAGGLSAAEKSAMERPAAVGSLEAMAPRKEEGEALRLVNSVRLGPLALRFEGPGHLRGRRPLLMFRFERLQLLLGGKVWLERELPPPPAQRMPFFALIASERHAAVGAAATSGWLAARGRGGGLALWLLEA